MRAGCVVCSVHEKTNEVWYHLLTVESDIKNSLFFPNDPIVFCSYSDREQLVIQGKVYPQTRPHRHVLNQFHRRPLLPALVTPYLPSSHCSHLDLGVQFVNLLPEVVPEFCSLGFQGGSEKSILDREHLCEQGDVLHLIKTRDMKQITVMFSS